MVIISIIVINIMFVSLHRHRDCRRNHHRQYSSSTSSSGRRLLAFVVTGTCLIFESDLDRVLYDLKEEGTCKGFRRRV